jgi:hypothetical protein
MPLLPLSHAPARPCHPTSCYLVVPMRHGATASFGQRAAREYPLSFAETPRLRGVVAGDVALLVGAPPMRSAPTAQSAMRKACATLDREDRTPEADAGALVHLQAAAPPARVTSGPRHPVQKRNLLILLRTRTSHSAAPAGGTARSQREQHYRASRKAGLWPNSSAHLVFANLENPTTDAAYAIA